MHSQHSDQSGSSSTESPRPRTARVFGLLDRLAVVREHWLAVGLVAAVVLALVLLNALLMTPTYEASASLTIQSSVGSLSDDLSVALGKPSKVETEMEVLRSFRVAKGAARLLMGLDAHPPTEALAKSMAQLARSERGMGEQGRGDPADDQEPRPDLSPVPGAGASEGGPSGAHWYRIQCAEVDAYRPLDMFLRRFTGESEPVRLTVFASSLPVEGQREKLTINFPAEGQAPLLEGEEEARELTDFGWGVPFKANGRLFRCEKPARSLAGKSYRVLLQDPAEFAESVFAGVTVRQIGRRTDMVAIGSTASTPYDAREQATALAQSYLDLRQMRKKQEVYLNQAWLTQEVHKYRLLLAPLETDLDTYIQENKATLLGEQATSNLETQLVLTGRLADLDREQAQEKSRLARLEKAGSQSTRQIMVVLGPEGANSMTSELSQKYADLSTELEQLKFDEFREGTKRYQRKQFEIAGVERKLKEILALALEDRIVDQALMVSGLGLQIKALEKQLQQAKKEMETLPARESGLARLKAKVERTRLLLARFEEERMKLKSAGFADDIAATMIDVARPPRNRTSPNLTRMGLLGIGLGLLAGVGLAFLLDSLDSKIRTPQQLEECTGLAIFGTIPAQAPHKKKARELLKTQLVTVQKPNSVISEAYRSLRANVRFSPGGERVSALAITSAVPQEGKSTTVCNLGVVMAQGGSKTIIVDADMRRPSTHLHFGAERRPGLADVLKGDLSFGDAVRETGIENLSMLYAGRPTSNPGALLDSAPFVELLADLRASYDFVLFDVPPALAVADSAAFFQSLDGVLLLTHYGRCSADVVDGARAQVERVGGRLLGAILNAYDVSRANRRSYGYYGYGGYYGRDGYYDSADGGDESRDGRDVKSRTSQG